MCAPNEKSVKGDEEPLVYIYHQILGSNNTSMIDYVVLSINLHRYLRPVSREQKIIERPFLMTMFEDVGHYDLETKNQTIVRAYQQYAYTQLEIGYFLELHRATISRIANKLTR